MPQFINQNVDLSSKYSILKKMSIDKKGTAIINKPTLMNSARRREI
jgi:hypothetical protein